MDLQHAHDLTERGFVPRAEQAAKKKNPWGSAVAGLGGGGGGGGSGAVDGTRLAALEQNQQAMTAQLTKLADTTEQVFKMLLSQSNSNHVPQPPGAPRREETRAAERVGGRAGR